jgi:hypothetical protein
MERKSERAKERRSDEAMEGKNNGVTGRCSQSLALSVPPSLRLSFALSLFLSACSVPLYKVAPLPQNTPIEAGQTATANSLEVTASALIEDDQAFARFDANLPLAGLVVVDIKLLNRTATPTKDLKFELQDATGKRFPQLEAKKALKQMMKFEGVRLYPIEGKRQTLEQLQAIALPKKLPLAAQEEKRGVLFFHAKQDAATLKGLVLTVKGSPQPIRLALN